MDISFVTIEVVGTSFAIMGVLVLIWRFLNPVVKNVNALHKWLESFRRDWEGEPASAGRDKVSGVMERLNRLDGELSRNGGKSLKDVVIRLDTKMDKLIKRIDSIEEKLK